MSDIFAKLKKDKKIRWTSHILEKMRYYRLSPSLIKRVIRYPERNEEGIAERTIASMKVNKSKKRREEIWVMYQKATQNHKGSGLPSALSSAGKIILISAWRYPGKSPAKNPIPQEIIEEAREILSIYQQPPVISR